jgi:hypothetical protein
MPGNFRALATLPMASDAIVGFVHFGEAHYFVESILHVVD